MAITHFNTRGNFWRCGCKSCARDDISVEQPAHGWAFDAVLVPLTPLATTVHSGGGRIRTRGTTYLLRSGQLLYVQDGSTGVRVQTESIDRYTIGDRVEVAGFVEIHGRVAALIEATVRRIAPGQPPEPLAIPPETILRINADASRTGQMAEPGDYQGCLVTFPAEVIDLQRSGMGGVILLLAGETSLTAVAKPDVFAQLQSIEPGSSVQATGIVQFAATEEEDRLQMARPFVVGRLELLVRSASDIVVRRAPSWWKPQPGRPVGRGGGRRGRGQRLGGVVATQGRRTAGPHRIEAAG